MTVEKSVAFQADARPVEEKFRLFHLFGGKKLPASPNLTLYLEDDYMQLDRPCLTGELGGKAVVAYRIAQEEFKGLAIQNEADGEHVAFAWFHPIVGKADRLTIDMGPGVLFDVKVCAEVPREFIAALTVPHSFIDSIRVPYDSWEGYSNRIRPYRPQPQAESTGRHSDVQGRP